MWFPTAPVTASLLSLIVHSNNLVAATVVTATSQARYTLRLPDTAKYYPKEIDALIRQYDAASSNRQAAVKPVMKLFANADEGEKYYDFDTFLTVGGGLKQEEEVNNGRHYLPVKVHKSVVPTREDARGDGWTAWFKSPLEKRQTVETSCPPQNQACSNLGQPGYCCPGGTVCISVPNTGFGDVGCCPNGQTCNGGLNGCAAGYYQCGQGSSAGCCLPGYLCSPSGCILDTSGVPTAGPTVTQISTISVGLDICQNGYYPCPPSLSFGCCQIGYLCGVTNCPYNTGPGTPGTEYGTNGYNIPTSAIVIIPSNTIGGGGDATTEGFSTIPRPATVPTAGQPAPKITNAPGAILSLGSGNCPGGFSTCGAQFNGGCCRFGRACGVSYCPVPTGGTNIPTVSTITTTNGGGAGCPGGWYSCPADFQGGCCPSGYGCGILNCPAITQQGGVVIVLSTAPAVQKISPVTRPGTAVHTYGELWGRYVIAGWICSYVLLLSSF